MHFKVISHNHSRGDIFYLYSTKKIKISPKYNFYSIFPNDKIVHISRINRGEMKILLKDSMTMKHIECSWTNKNIVVRICL